MAHRVPARLTATEGRRFAFTVGGAFAVLGMVAWWRDNLVLTSVFGALAVLLGLSGLAAPQALGPLQRGWMGLAHLISKITTPIFMGVIYLLVISPIGLAMSLVGKRPLRPLKGATTYWRTRAEGAERGDLTRQF